ncbi:hypothetical protein KM043_008922 [Ampulex compressa]|nr:hypothetical protein KM043_008922 [Ampulex compressa]
MPMPTLDSAQVPAAFCYLPFFESDDFRDTSPYEKIPMDLCARNAPSQRRGGFWTFRPIVLENFENGYRIIDDDDESFASISKACFAVDRDAKLGSFAINRILAREAGASRVGEARKFGGGERTPGV